MDARQCRMIVGFWYLRVKPNYQRISRKAQQMPTYTVSWGFIGLMQS
jgi:hypothetical protein